MPMPQSNRVDRAAVRSVLADSRPDLISRTNQQIDDALASIDQDAVYNAERSALTVAVWDRTSPINDVDAQHFLDRDDVPDEGDVYLLFHNGQVVIFQPHEPGIGGLQPISKGQGNARGRAHADAIASDTATIEIVRQVISTLDNS